MKSKRRKILLCVLCLMFVTGCGAVTDNSSNNSNQETIEVTVTKDNLNTFPVTDEEYFDTEPVDGGVSITGCSSNEKVIVIPETINGKKVVGVSTYAFGGMQMEGIVFPNSVESIGRGAFEMCHQLKYIDLGSGLKSIGSMAFNNCTNLTSVKFPEGMTTFYGAVFYNCDSLTDVIIPGSVIQFSNGIISSLTCPNAIVVTPKGSAVESYCIERNIPYKNS